MSEIIRFSQKDFRRGVNAAMTLAPLREAMRTFARNAFERFGPDKAGRFEQAGRSVSETENARNNSTRAKR